MRGFDFFVGGIEDGIVEALEPLHVKSDGGYVKTIASYGGELDSDNIKRALGELTPRLPIMLAAYGDGEDVESPATAPVPPTLPRLFRHDCTFTVLCCSGDARGERARRRGAGSSVGIYRMIADVWERIAGLQFKIMDGDETVLLNPEPMKPSGIEYLARLPQLTAYSVHFDTYFRYETPDRSKADPMLVRELVFEVDNTFEKGDANLPGVVIK
jgi:hypothetical protein